MVAFSEIGKILEAYGALGREGKPDWGKLPSSYPKTDERNTTRMGTLKAAEKNLDDLTPVAPLICCTVTSHPLVPVPSLNKPQSDIDYDFDATARITVVGIGPFGSRTAELLSRNVRGITCHEVCVDAKSSPEGFSSLLSSVQQSDLLFIISSFDDPSCASIAQAVGNASCRAGILTVAIAPLPQRSSIPQGQESWYNTLFGVSGRSLPVQSEPIIPEGDALTGYAMRHMVAAIANLITHQTGICIDFADVAAILREGSMGRLGVGVGSGDSRGSMAAKGAIKRLEEQGVNLAGAAGILAAVHGSGDLSMEDFDAASEAIHEQVSPSAKVMVGLISDENLGGFVKVTVLTVH